jgi:chromosomal replication initiation ATPase DnaA
MKKEIIDAVLKAVEWYTGISVDEITGSSRLAKDGLITARFLAYEILHNTFKLNWKETANALNRSSHATVVNALNTIREDKEYFEKFKIIANKIIARVYETNENITKMD